MELYALISVPGRQPLFQGRQAPLAMNQSPLRGQNHVRAALWSPIREVLIGLFLSMATTAIRVVKSMPAVA